MLPTVNLYVDKMNVEEPVRVADVYAATENLSSSYVEAAVKIGLTTREYSEFRQALLAGNAVYVRLPQRIDAMAGVHRRSGHVYALRNVVVPAGTMGWTVNLADGTQVIVPQICSNLSMNRARMQTSVVSRQQPKRIAAGQSRYIPPAVIHETPVVFTPPPIVLSTIVAPASGAASDVAAAAPTAAVNGGRSALPFLALLAPALAAFANHGGSIPAAPITIAPCSAGSNAMGVCRP